MQVPLPLLPEQCAITRALSDVDRLLEALDALIAKKRTVKQAAMQQLLTGKTRLPGFGGKSNNAKVIATQEREATRTPPVPVGPHEAEAVPADYKHTEVGFIPEDWDVAVLRSCLRAAPDYGINAAAVAFDDELPTYLRITDISEEHRFRPSPRVSVSHPNRDSFYLTPGDLVFARTGASVGKSYLYNPADGPMVFAGFLVRVTPDAAKLAPEYCAFCVQSERYWNWVATMSARSGQPGINGQEYGSLALPRPQLPEQHAIAAVLSDIDAEIDALEQRREKTHAIKQGMMQQLLTGRVRLVKSGTDSTPGEPRSPRRKRDMTEEVHRGVAVQRPGGAAS